MSMGNDDNPGAHERVRVFLCEDDTDFRILSGLWISADPHLDVVGESANLAACEDALHDARPDVLMLDPLLPGEPVGAEAVASLRRASPGLKVLIYSGLPRSAIRERTEIS